MKAADEGIALQAAVGRGDAVEGGEEFGGVGLAPGAEVAVTGLEGHEEGFGLAPKHFWHGQGAVLAEVAQHVAFDIEPGLAAAIHLGHDAASMAGIGVGDFANAAAAEGARGGDGRAQFAGDDFIEEMSHGSGKSPIAENGLEQSLCAGLGDIEHVRESLGPAVVGSGTSAMPSCGAKDVKSERRPWSFSGQRFFSSFKLA